jgi:ERCC4-type nuclease
MEVSEKLMNIAGTAEPKPASLKLPALRGLGELADTTPVIIIDSREQDPLTFQRLPSKRGMLRSGDYSIAGLEELFSIERKSVPDLVGCCMGQNRDRFERELHRLRGYRFKRLLVIGRELEVQQGVAFSRINPKSVFASLVAWECRYDIPAVWCNTSEAAALQVERWAFYFSREVVQSANALLRGARQVEEAMVSRPPAGQAM